MAGDGFAAGRIVMLSGVRHGGHYARLLVRRPVLWLGAIAEDLRASDWRADESRKVAEANGLPLLPLERALDADRFDVAVICSEPTRHAALALAAIEQGLDVIVDKPVATTTAAAIGLRDAAVRGGRTVGVVSRLGAPAMQRARTAVDGGRVGFVRHIDVEFLASGAHFASSVERPELVVDTGLSGGGEAMNFLGYGIDAVRFLSGCEVTDVHCEMATLFSEDHRRHGVEDVAVTSVGCTNGVTATITIGRVARAPAGGATASSIRVLGSHGHLSISDDRPSVRLFTADGRIVEHAVGESAVDATLRWTFDDVLDARSTGRPPRYTIDDAVAALASIEAAYRSSASGQPAAVTAV